MDGRFHGDPILAERDGVRGGVEQPGRRVIRRATAGDLDQVGEIERVSFSDPWSRQSFASFVADARVFFGVGLGIAGDVLGYVVAAFVAGEGEIANLAVDQRTRRVGLGGALLDAALAEAEARFVKSVYLEVRDSNEVARSLYASRGFREIGRRTRYYRRPIEDALVLRVDLFGGP